MMSDNLTISKKFVLDFIIGNAETIVKAEHGGDSTVYKFVDEIVRNNGFGGVFTFAQAMAIEGEVNNHQSV